MTLNIWYIEIQPYTLRSTGSVPRARSHAGRSTHRVPIGRVGFETMAQLGEVFTPKCWELVEALKTTGPLTIYALAKHSGGITATSIKT
ncbi:MAG: hypothetical protein R3F44_13975 [Candidatus Competibacteraceae bacterium]